jgi:hypothetical protein
MSSLIIILILAAVLAAAVALVEGRSDIAIGIIALTVLLLFSASAYDGQSLTPKSEQMVLLDKWHKEDCDAMFDGQGNYIGENCGNRWVLVVAQDGQRQERKVSGSIFKQFPVGANLRRQYKVGQLGIVHDEQWEID